MKHIIFFLVSATLMMGMSIVSCTKRNNNPSVSITFETNPAAGSNQAPAPGPGFPLVVTITSAMPATGVKIDVTARAEGSTIYYFSQSVNTENVVNNFTITGAPVGVTSVVEVTVTDLANAAFTNSASYRFSRK